MNDVRDLLDDATRHAPRPDPVHAVRRRIAARRRRHVAGLAAGGTATGLAIVAVAAMVSTSPRTEEAPVVTSSSADSAPSGGTVPVTKPPDTGVDTPNSGLMRFSALVTANPDAFVGVYIDPRGSLVAVFGMDAQPETWAARLRDAAGSTLWRTARCGVTHADLDAVMRALETFEWPSGTTPAFGAHIDPANCSVRITSHPLPSVDADALVKAFGPKVTFAIGSPSRR